MSLYDDMFDLEDHFKKYVKNPVKTAALNRKERKGLSEAFKRILQSHSDMERKEMKTEAVVSALATIFNTYGLVREVPKDGQ